MSSNNPRTAKNTLPVTVILTMRVICPKGKRARRQQGGGRAGGGARQGAENGDDDGGGNDVLVLSYVRIFLFFSIPLADGYGNG